MNDEELRKQVQQIRWHHSIDLGNGIITPGAVDNLSKLKSIGLPNDLTNKTVLDIGAWDGFYSFEAEKRGAKRILATDSYVWRGVKLGSGGSKKGFLLARKILNSQVEDLFIDILDISPEKIGTFDVVLFLGVLYHMRHPLLSLEKVASVTNEMAIIETATDMLDFERPAMAFYPGGEFNGGSTTWTGANPQAIAAMLKVAGFSKVKLHFAGKIRYRTTGKPGLTKKPDYSQIDQIPGNRVVFHAWK